jgi:hypothetical protein
MAALFSEWIGAEVARLFPSDGFRGALVIEQEVGDDLSESLIFVAKVADFPSAASARAIVLAAPAVERRLGDPQFAAQLHSGLAGAYLPERFEDLLVCEFAGSHSCLLMLAHIIPHTYRTNG